MSKNDMKSSVSFGTDGIEEFFDGELNDLIIHFLSSLYTASKDNMTDRQRELIGHFLENNPLVGAGKNLMKEIDKALKEKSLPKRRSMLENCGFTIEKGSHDKMYFHTPRYSFTLANSGSEYRGGDNMLSDIKKKIDIYKKV